MEFNPVWDGVKVKGNSSPLEDAPLEQIFRGLEISQGIL